MTFDAEQAGNKIRLLREARNWSQDKVADQVDVTCSYVGKIERGEINARIGTYISLAALFEVTLDYLLTDKPIFD